MTIHITAGDCLKEILEKLYPDETFIPFREAMIQGSYTAKLFSQDFINERAAVHNVSPALYTENLRPFLEFLTHIRNYDRVVLWFGDEPFCNANKKVVIQTLKEYGYQGALLSNTVVEETGEIIKSEALW